VELLGRRGLGLDTEATGHLRKFTVLDHVRNNLLVFRSQSC